MTALMQKMGQSRLQLLSGLLLLAVLVLATSVAMAQRSNNLFRGTWSGTFTPEILLGVPDEDIERMSEPFRFELRVFNRGRAELYFFSEEEEWDFRSRNAQITEVGVNGIILTRLEGSADNSQNSISLNFTKTNDTTMLMDWSLITTRDNLRFDGLDEMAVAGATELTLTDD